MSSHHVIREKQEPALLVISLINFSDELLGQLLEWSPTVVALPHTAEELNSLGIKVDVVVGHEVTAHLQEHVKLIFTGAENPIAAALNHLANEGYPAVNVVTDDVETNQYEQFIERINLVIYSGTQKIYPVSSGFSKWKPAGERVRILSLCADLQTTGLLAQPDGDHITLADGLFSLTFTGPYLFIAEEL